jgi:hypothetical protein
MKTKILSVALLAGLMAAIPEVGATVTVLIKQNSTPLEIPVKAYFPSVIKIANNGSKKEIELTKNNGYEDEIELDITENVNGKINIDIKGTNPDSQNQLTVVNNGNNTKKNVNYEVEVDCGDKKQTLTRNGVVDSIVINGDKKMKLKAKIIEDSGEAYGRYEDVLTVTISPTA